MCAENLLSLKRTLKHPKGPVRACAACGSKMTDIRKIVRVSATVHLIAFLVRCLRELMSAVLAALLGTLALQCAHAALNPSPLQQMMFDYHTNDQMYALMEQYQSQ